jgi:DnaJ-class molecular chaperone
MMDMILDMQTGINQQRIYLTKMKDLIFPIFCVVMIIFLCIMGEYESYRLRKAGKCDECKGSGLVDDLTWPTKNSCNKCNGSGRCKNENYQ